MTTETVPAASAAEPPLERLQRADAVREQRSGRRVAPGVRITRVEVDAQPVEPVGAVLGRGHGRLGLRRPLGQLALELVYAGPQPLDLGALGRRSARVRGAPRFSAPRG